MPPKTTQEIAALLDVLSSRGVSYFKSGDFEVGLMPSMPQPQHSSDEEEDSEGWRGLSAEDREILGAG